MLNVKTVTVIGANGTMGRNVSAIFASFGNAKVYMLSRSIEKSSAAKEKAYQTVRAESVKTNMYPADFSMLDKCISESDLVFDSTAENWEIKSAVAKQVAEAAVKNLQHSKQMIFATGTSGLSITGLAELFPEELRGNYMGIHMFNPPYTMPLCEMTPTIYTNQAVFDGAMAYCKEVLHRNVVVVKDFPAFLGNRIGFQFINEALQCAEKYKYNGGIDYIDAILGSFTGRNMPPLVTANFVGLDVHKAIVDNIYNNTDDFAHQDFILPNFAQDLIDRGYLGRKAGGGLYKTVVHDSGIKIHQVYDIESGVYRDVIKYTFPFAETMIAYLKDGEYAKAFKTLKENRSPEAELCVHFLVKYVLYSLRAAELVGFDIHSADDCMASGFNWCPPLAMIAALGCDEENPVEAFRKLCLERIDPIILERIDLHHLLLGLEPSKYDFRLYIKAKH